MSTATLTSKGRITIPRTVRHDLRLQTGDRVVFIQDAPNRLKIGAAYLEPERSLIQKQHLSSKGV